MLVRLLTELLDLNRKELETIQWHINELLNKSNKEIKDER